MLFSLSRLFQKLAPLPASGGRPGVDLNIPPPPDRVPPNHDPEALRRSLGFQNGVFAKNPVPSSNHPDGPISFPPPAYPKEPVPPDHESRPNSEAGEPALRALADAINPPAEPRSTLATSSRLAPISTGAAPAYRHPAPRDPRDLRIEELEHRLRGSHKLEAQHKQAVAHCIELETKLEALTARLEVLSSSDLRYARSYFANPADPLTHLLAFLRHALAKADPLPLEKFSAGECAKQFHNWVRAHPLLTPAEARPSLELDAKGAGALLTRIIAKQELAASLPLMLVKDATIRPALYYFHRRA